jgi:transketolase
MTDFKAIKELAKQYRKNILFAAYSAGAKSAHIGGALSIVEILACLYGNILKLDPKNPLDLNRDRLILSKGHACLSLYSALVEKKYFQRQELENFEKSGSFLLGHPVMNREKGIEFSTGSLGMGLSLAIGVAYAGKVNLKEYSTFVIVGDGECNEGSIWEGALLGSHLNLQNLKVIIDKNNFQQTGENKNILNLADITSKWKSFGWNTYEVDGHNIHDLFKVLNLKSDNNKPTAIVANTIKGKGFSFFENNNDWHHNILTKKNYELALQELN